MARCRVGLRLAITGSASAYITVVHLTSWYKDYRVYIPAATGQIINTEIGLDNRVPEGGDGTTAGSVDVDGVAN